MATRHLYLARHGEADALGTLTDAGRRQAALLGERLAAVPVDVVWHSPLPRAAASATQIARHLPAVPVAEAPELVDHVPYVPPRDELPSSRGGFFDGYDDAEAAAGRALADALVARFGGASSADTHEVLVTHAYQVAWLVRDALRAPPVAWLSIPVANAALTVLEHRPDLPPTVVMVNDLGHLPAELRWTGFRGVVRP